jgi:hypothetical protein
MYFINCLFLNWSNLPEQITKVDFLIREHSLLIRENLLGDRQKIGFWSKIL